MATQAREQEKRLQFKGVNFNANKLAPEASEGKYGAVIDAVVLGQNKKQYAMLTFTIVLKKALSKGKGVEKSVGATVRDWISFFPDGDRSGNPARRQFRALCDQLGVKTGDVLPTRIEDEGDFKKLLKVLKKAKITVWITEKEENGEMRARVNYSAPRGFLADEANGVDDSDEEEDEEEEEMEDDDDEDEKDEDSDDEDEEEEEEDEDDDSDEDDDDDDDEEEDEKPKKKKGKK
jgi:hypothetical protein